MSILDECLYCWQMSLFCLLSTLPHPSLTLSRPFRRADLHGTLASLRAAGGCKVTITQCLCTRTLITQRILCLCRLPEPFKAKLRDDLIPRVRSLVLGCQNFIFTTHDSHSHTFAYGFLALEVDGNSIIVRSKGLRFWKARSLLARSQKLLLMVFATGRH